MANVLTPAIALITNTKLQDTLYTKNIARQFCSEALFKGLEKQMGGSIERPYRVGTPNVVTYVPGTDIAKADITYGTDIFTIDAPVTTEISSVDKFEKKQSVVDIVEKEAEAHGEAMAQYIDQTVFTQIAADAGTTFGVTAGAWDSASATAATEAEFTGELFVSMLSKFKATLGKNNAKDGEMFIVVDFDQYEVAEEKLMTIGFNTADSVIGEGFKGKVRGVMIYASNNLPVTTGVVSVVGGIKGSTDLAMQSDVEMSAEKEPRNNSTNFWVDSMFGVDTPVSLKPQLIEFLIDQA